MKSIRLFIYFISIYLILIYSFFNYCEYFYNYVVLDNFSFNEYEYKIANVTAYTPYCDGCIGVTSYGINVLSSPFYNDYYYGDIYILAGDESIPFGSIVYFFDLNIYGIVLDRGGAIGYDRKVQFDLLLEDYSSAINFGVKENVRYMFVRYGF